MKRFSIVTCVWVFCMMTANTFAQNDRTTLMNVQGDDIFYHTVERGQTVYAIAKMYNVTEKDIFRLNPRSNESIKAGERLKIPQKIKTVTPTEKADENYIFHTIQEGETLYGVSRRYGVNHDLIIEANPGLSQKTFSFGKTIRIPSVVKQQQTTEIVTRRGVKEVYYRVPERETQYNICRIFKTTEEELLRLNPELSGGLRAGMTLRIPLRIPENELPLTVVEDPNEINAMLSAKPRIRLENAAMVALLLPFDSTNVTNPTVARGLITEYYEGFLIAIDSLRNMGMNIEVFPQDVGEGTSELKKLMNNKNFPMKDMNLIIGGVTDEQIKLLADYAKEHQIKYIIPFKRNNDEVLNNAYVFQVNTPPNYLYANASFAGANLFTKHNIIFLDTDDQDNQTEFINEFKKELKDRNIAFKDAKYNPEKFPEDIKAIMSTAKPNVIVPISNSLDALLKIKTVLRSITETQPEYVIQLFGYPYWQTYYKDCLDDFHALETYIFSYFYSDNMNLNVKKFNEGFKFWYSKSPTPATFTPKYPMMGFDTGMFFLGALHRFGKNFEDNLPEINYKSIQTGFNFERVNNWGGFINTNIYIVHFNKDFTITRMDFK